MIHWFDQQETGPQIVTEIPGPISQKRYEQAEKFLHGYSSQTKLLPIVFSFGINDLLFDVDTNGYIDFTSGTYCSAMGHGNRKIADAVGDQLYGLANVHSWLTEIKLDVARMLSDTLPISLHQFEFFCDGTTAVEAAIRLVRLAAGLSFGFGPIMCFVEAFHGKSTGAAALTFRDLEGVAPSYQEAVHMAYPLANSASMFDKSEKSYLQYLNQAVDFGRQKPIAIFVEPIQGVAGCRVPPDWFLPMLRDLANEWEIPLVVDEIFSGFGRSGRMWASTGIVPDILIFGKIAGGGYPLSGLAMTERIAASLKGSSVTTTYGGNPVSMAACKEVLEMLTVPELWSNIETIGQLMESYLLELQHDGRIESVSGKGCMWGFEFHTPEEGRKVFVELGKRGVLTQIEGSIGRLCPPLTARVENVTKGMDILSEVVKENCWRITKVVEAV